MAKIYTKNVWADETLTGDARYTILENGGGAFKDDMQINLKTSVAVAGTAVTAARMNNLEDGLDAVDTRANFVDLTSKATPVDADSLSLYDSVAAAYKRLTWANLKATLKTYFDTLYGAIADVPHVAEGRLTLTSGTPVTTADVTAATSVYYTPYSGNRLALYDGAKWVLKTFAELTGSLSGKTADTNYDVFVYDNSGTLTLDLVAWTNATTRATALVYQDGTLVKSGATGRRYLGTIRTTGTTGQCEDSAAKRFVWNMYNRVERALQVLEATDSWNYTTTSWRQVNGATANQVAVVVGLLEDAINLSAVLVFKNTAGSGLAYTGIGEDSTTAATSGCIGMTNASPAANITCSLWVILRKPPAAIGYHYYAWLELGAANDTMYGDAGAPDRFQSGMNGVWRA